MRAFVQWGWGLKGAACARVCEQQQAGAPCTVCPDTRALPVTLARRALALGVVSTRRIYAEASALLQQQPEQAAPAGLNPLALLGWLLTSSGGATAVRRRQRKAAAAAAAAEARAFHARMAEGREGQQAHGATLHHWRWRGALLTDYLAAPASGPNAASAGERPAILLCHGFGAFSGEGSRRWCQWGAAVGAQGALSMRQSCSPPLQPKLALHIHPALHHQHPP